jgi:ABC-2 type transport system ATP-binding protein
LIVTEKLTKAYDGQRALRDVSLDIRRGELFGILGPNGAGKTTLFSILSGRLAPTYGTARIANLDCVRDAKKVKRIVGVVPQETAAYDLLTAYENLRTFGALYGLRGDRLAKRIDALLRLVSLHRRAHDLVSSYSGGMKHRLNIALGLVHDPEVILMDEPTTGLDPLAREELWGVIRGLKAANKTVLLTTHYLHEAEALCNRVAILDEGKIKALGAPQALGDTLEKVYRQCVTADSVARDEQAVKAAKAQIFGGA